MERTVSTSSQDTDTTGTNSARSAESSGCDQDLPPRRDIPSIEITPPEYRHEKNGYAALYNDDSDGDSDDDNAGPDEINRLARPKCNLERAAAVKQSVKGMRPKKKAKIMDRWFSPNRVGPCPSDSVDEPSTSQQQKDPSTLQNEEEQKKKLWNTFKAVRKLVKAKKAKGVDKKRADQLREAAAEVHDYACVFTDNSDTCIVAGVFSNGAADCVENVATPGTNGNDGAGGSGMSGNVPRGRGLTRANDSTGTNANNVAVSNAPGGAGNNRQARENDAFAAEPQEDVSNRGTAQDNYLSPEDAVNPTTADGQPQVQKDRSKSRPKIFLGKTVNAIKRRVSKPRVAPSPDDRSEGPSQGPSSSRSVNRTAIPSNGTENHDMPGTSGCNVASSRGRSRNFSTTEIDPPMAHDNNALAAQRQKDGRNRGSAQKNHLSPEDAVDTNAAERSKSKPRTFVGKLKNVFRRPTSVGPSPDDRAEEPGTSRDPRSPRNVNREAMPSNDTGNSAGDPNEASGQQQMKKKRSKSLGWKISNIGRRKRSSSRVSPSPDDWSEVPGSSQGRLSSGNVNRSAMPPNMTGNDDMPGTSESNVGSSGMSRNVPRGRQMTRGNGGTGTNANNVTVSNGPGEAGNNRQSAGSSGTANQAQAARGNGAPLNNGQPPAGNDQDEDIPFDPKI